MRAVVVYESMYGNTHLVADAIATGLSPVGEVITLPVDEATPEVLATVDLLVVGGPTHAHGMSRAGSRESAIQMAAKPDADLELDENAEGPGFREWFKTLDDLKVEAAAFDTRVQGPAPITGRASKGIAKRLRGLGCSLIAGPESFLVGRDNHLLDDERAHARSFGARLAAEASGHD